MSDIISQNWILPLGIVLFFIWRFYRFQGVRKKLPQLLSSGALLVDVRSKEEFSMAHHPKSINVPLIELEKKSRDWKKEQVIVLCCASGSRSSMALGVLKKNGFHSIYNVGSWMNATH